MPPYVRELRSRNRPRGLPCLGDSIESAADDVMDASNTPFRLPKVGGDKKEAEELYKVWSRYGYEYHNKKPIDVGEVSTQFQTSPRVVSQELRRSQLQLPKFQSAVIGPSRSYSQQHPRLFAQDFSDPAFFKSFMHKAKGVRRTLDDTFPELDPTPTPNPNHERSDSPVKSGKSIHWKLSSYRNFTIDTKGRSRAQGPFSRGFTVHCKAPSNWLRMKLGRSKTTLF